MCILVFLYEMPVQVLCPCFLLDYLYFIVKLQEFSIYSEYVICQIYVLQIFSYHLWFIYSFYEFLWMPRNLKMFEVHLSVFTLVVSTFLLPRVVKILYYIFFQKFVGLAFALMSVIHLKLICVWCEVGVKLHIFLCGFPVFPTCFVEIVAV